MFKRNFPIILCIITLVVLVCNLFISLFNTDNPTLEFEAYLFYVTILVMLSFPLGSFINLILLIAYHIINPVLSIKLENIIFSILVTIISSISFYYQWYVLFPKLRNRFIKFKNVYFMSPTIGIYRKNNKNSSG